MMDVLILANMLRESMANGQTPTLTVISASMSPLFYAGDQALIEAVEAADLQAGDIVTIQTAVDLVTHRFLGWQNGRLLTRGDRPLTLDPLWKPEQLVGRVIARERNGRLLSLATGAGGQLNRHLTWATKTEWRLLARGKQTANITFAARLVHKLFFLWATGITAVVGKIAEGGRD